jgi:hypothetical protein
MFITVFTTARYIKPGPALPSCSRHTLISKSHLTPWPSKWPLALNFPTKILHVFSSIRVTFPSHPPRVHRPNNIWLVKITKLLIMEFSPFSCYFLLAPNICSAPHSRTLSVSMWDTEFYTHTKQQAKLEFCIFSCLWLWTANRKTITAGLKDT